MATSNRQRWLRALADPAPGRRSGADRRAALTLALALLPAAATLRAQGEAPTAIDANVARIREHKDQGEWQQAMDLIAAGLRDAPERGLGTVCLRVEAGDVCRRQYRWQESAEWLDGAERALPAPGNAGVQYWQAMIAIARGALAIERGLPDLAHEHCQQAARSAPPTDRALAERITYLELRIQRALDQREAALATLSAHEARFGPDLGLRLRAALAILQDRGAPPAQLAMVDDWLAAARAEVDVPPDERSFHDTVRVLRALGKGDHAEAARALDALQAQLSGQLSERPFTLQVLRLRLAHESGAPLATVRERHDELAATWQRLLDEWRRQPVAATGLGAMVPVERQRALSELIRTHVAHDGADGPERALQRVLDVGDLGSTVRAAGAPSCSVAAVRQALTAPGRGVLVHVAGPDRTWVFALGAEATHVFDLPARALQIERLGRELVAHVHLARTGGADDRAARERAARALASELLPPAVLDAIAGWHGVTFVGQESFGYVPFELLRLPDGRRLGAARAVSYLPSLNVGAWLHTARPAPSPRAPIDVSILACADVTPARAAGAPPLPLTAEQQARLAFADSAAHFHVTTGRAVRAADLHARADCTLLELIAHGDRDERRTDPQGIVLGDGSTLWPRDIETLPLPPYVVLAACRAGRGRPRRGDDGRNLPSGAALLAGSRAVVAPWLEVEYLPTLALLEHLHRGLFRDGLALDEALRRARVAVADEHGDDAIDAFLFHATGLTEAPLAAAVAPPREAAPRWPWVLVTVAALSLATALRRRRAAR